MEPEIIVALIGLAGVVAASILGAVGYYLKTQSERLVSRKLVLFYLLEIRHSLKSTLLDPKEMAKQYMAYCREFFRKRGIIQDEDFPEEFKDLITDHLALVRNESLCKLEEDLLTPFVLELKEMAKQDPIGAYRIKGKESLGKLISIQNSYEREFKDKSIPDMPEPMLKVVNDQFLKIKGDAFSELINELDDCIRSVSRSCSLLSLIRCKKIMSEKISSDLNFSEMGFDSLLDEYLDAVKAAEEEMKAFTQKSEASTTAKS